VVGKSNSRYQIIKRFLRQIVSRIPIRDKKRVKMQSDSINRVDLEDASIRGGRKGRMIRPKMDVSKALSIMGFTSARTLDQSSGNNALTELNSALSKKMESLEKKKKMAIEKGKNIPERQKNPAADKARDDIRTLHEAYQFLAKKYLKHYQRRQRKEEYGLEEEYVWNIEEDEDYEPPVFEDDDDDNVFIEIIDTAPSLKKEIGSLRKKSYKKSNSYNRNLQTDLLQTQKKHR